MSEVPLQGEYWENLGRVWGGGFDERTRDQNQEKKTAQRYLAHKKLLPARTLLQEYA